MLSTREEIIKEIEEKENFNMMKVKQIEYLYHEESGDLNYIEIQVQAEYDGVDYVKAKVISKEEFEGMSENLSELIELVLRLGNNSLYYKIKKSKTA